MTQREQRYLETIRHELKELSKEGYPAGDFKKIVGYDFCLFLKTDPKGYVRIPTSLIDDAVGSGITKNMLIANSGNLSRKEANNRSWAIRIERSASTYRVHCFVEE